MSPPPLDPAAIDRARMLMMAALDGEIDGPGRAELDRVLASDAALRAEWERLQRVKRLTAGSALDRPPEELWDRYWQDVRRRMERRLAWVLVSAGALVLVCFAAAWGARWLWCSDAPWPVRLGLGILGAGAILLVASVVREKWAVNRDDPYREVRR